MDQIVFLVILAASHFFCGAIGRLITWRSGDCLFSLNIYYSERQWRQAEIIEGILGVLCGFFYLLLVGLHYWTINNLKE
ncbi:MAG: hypothetical protein WC514_01585 [Candidatus Paceibacterota bacterium]